METADQDAGKPTERSTAEEDRKLNISPLQATRIEPPDAHWLRMDPSLTRAVLAKTEEDLLGGLAALMRNKVEHEQVSRRLAQVQIDLIQAKDELDAIKQQIRLAEEEIGTRIDEQTRIGEQITSVRREMATLREEHGHRLVTMSGLKKDADQARQLLAEADQRLAGVKDEANAMQAGHKEEAARLDQIKGERAALENELALLRTEVQDRLGAREALIQEIAVLEGHRFGLATRRELTAATEKAEPARREEELPRLFGSELHPISHDWDSYSLESEFHTEEELDAKKVAELVLDQA